MRAGSTPSLCHAAQNQAHLQFILGNLLNVCLTADRKPATMMHSGTAAVRACKSGAVLQPTIDVSSSLHLYYCFV